MRGPDRLCLTGLHCLGHPRQPGSGRPQKPRSRISACGDELRLFKTWFLTWNWSLWVAFASLRKVTSSSLLYSKQKIIFPSILPALSPPHNHPLPHTEPLATRLPRRICMWWSLPLCHVLRLCSANLSHQA